MPAFFVPVATLLVNVLARTAPTALNLGARGAVALGRGVTSLAKTTHAHLTSRSGLAIGLGASVNENLADAVPRTGVAFAGAMASYLSRNPVYALFGLGMAGMDFLRELTARSGGMLENASVSRIVECACLSLRRSDSLLGRDLHSCLSGLDAPKLDAKMKAASIPKTVLLYAVPFDTKKRLVEFIAKNGGLGLVINICDQTGVCCFWIPDQPEHVLGFLRGSNVSQVMVLVKSAGSVTPFIVPLQKTNQKLF